MSITNTETISFSDVFTLTLRGDTLTVGFNTFTNKVVERSKYPSSLNPHALSGVTTSFRTQKIKSSDIPYLYWKGLCATATQSQGMDAYDFRREILLGKLDKALHPLRWLLASLETKYTDLTGEVYEFVLPEGFALNGPHAYCDSDPCKFSDICRAELHAKLGDEAVLFYSPDEEYVGK